MRFVAGLLCWENCKANVIPEVEQQPAPARGVTLTECGHVMCIPCFRACSSPVAENLMADYPKPVCPVPPALGCRGQRNWHGYKNWKRGMQSFCFGLKRSRVVQFAVWFQFSTVCGPGFVSHDPVSFFSTKTMDTFTFGNKHKLADVSNLDWCIARTKKRWRFRVCL